MSPVIRLLLVDGLNLIRRVYAAQPGDDGRDKAQDGKTASVQSLRRALRECSPTHALVVFEGSEPTWRHRRFPQYKAGHKPMPEALRTALPEYRDAFAALGVRSFALPGAEADDVIGTLAAKTEKAGGSVIILSTDKIFFQLVSDHVLVRDHFRKVDLGRVHVRDRFGVEPERFVEFLALTGEATSGIPGVPGIGPKTAAKLIATFPSLEELLASARHPAHDAPSLPTKLAEKLLKHAEDARLAQSLVRLTTDLTLGLNLRSLQWTSPF